MQIELFGVFKGVDGTLCIARSRLFNIIMSGHISADPVASADDVFNRASPSQRIRIASFIATLNFQQPPRQIQAAVRTEKLKTDKLTTLSK